MRFNDLFQPWVKRNNGYGYITHPNDKSQDDGFFVDAHNRILYWPEQTGPGYVVEEEDVQEYVCLKANASDRVFAFSQVYLVLAIVAGLISIFPKLQVYTSVCHFSMFMATFFLILVASHIITFFTIDRNYRKKNLLQKIKTAEVIHAERPRANNIIPFTGNGQEVNRIKILLSSLFLICLFLFSSIMTWMVCISWSGAFLSLFNLLVLWGFIKLHYNAKTGITENETFFYKLQHDEEYLKSIIEQVNQREEFPQILTFFARIFGNWKTYVALVAVFVGLFYLEIYRWPILTSEKMTNMYQSKVLNRMWTGHGLLKWNQPVRVFVVENGVKSYTNDIKSRLDAYKDVTGLDLTTTEIQREANWIIEIMPWPKPKSVAGHAPFSVNMTEKEGLLQKVKIDFWPTEYEKNQQNTTSTDSAPLVRQMIMMSLGLPVPFDFTFGLTRDKSLSRYKTSETLLAIHYDARMKPGSKPSDLLDTVKLISNEIEQAPSFDEWLESAAHT
ncbi:MAG: hypothetical protein HWE34_08090 [Methylocystaceae bacterium]|nr:hypothetical protein [Methylocystaceae bacterium]